MILASGEGQLILIVVMAVIGAINWIAGKLKSPDQPPRKNIRGGVRPASPDSEEARMRRFLEALGLPSEEIPPPRRKLPPALAPSPPPLTQARVPKRPVARPPFLQEKAFPSPQDPSVAPPRARRAENPEPIPPIASAFETIYSQISAIPAEPTVTRTPDTDTLESSPAVAVRRMLDSPRELRTAFVLREVLGPAPGLQS